MIPDTLFVINEHLAANFTYFDLGEGDDPPVYLWEDSDGGSIPRSVSTTRSRASCWPRPRTTSSLSAVTVTLVQAYDQAYSWSHG
jgi:hypothetical protein